MTSLLSLITIIACQQGFDKDGSDINETNEYGETVDSEGNSLSTPNHDWDEDGYTEDQGDCDDDNPDVNPSMAEVYYDDIDSNCDGLNDFDADQDGHISSNWGGDDCDDSDATINPSIEDDPTDGIDSDCDGQDDPRFIYYAIDENVATSMGALTLGVDVDKRIHVVFEDAGELWYTNKSASLGTWRTSVSTEIPMAGDVAIGGAGQQLDGAVDGSYRFHIAYTELDGSGNLSTHYAYLKNVRSTVPDWVGGFEIEGINSTGNNLASHYLNLAVGTDDIPLFSYYDENANRPILSKLTAVPTGQQPSANINFREEVDYLIEEFDQTDGAPIGLHTALTVGPTNMAYVVYVDETSPNGTGSKPATQLSALTNTNFYCESDIVAEPGGISHALAVRPDNKLCVAYQDSEDLALKYACQVSASGCTEWDIQTIEGNIGDSTSLAMGFTSGSIPYIAYHHAPTGTLRVASLQGSEWDIATAGVAPGKDVGSNVQMAIDSDDRVHLAFFNSTDGNIWYAMGH